MVADTSDDMFCYICNTDDVSSTKMVCLAELCNSSDIIRSESITFSVFLSLVVFKLSLYFFDAPESPFGFSNS